MERGLDSDFEGPGRGVYVAMTLLSSWRAFWSMAAEQPEVRGSLARFVLYATVLFCRDAFSSSPLAGGFVLIRGEVDEDVMIYPQ